MVHAKENLNLVFTIIRNPFEIEVMKRSFKVHLATEGQIQKLKHTLENIFVCNAL